MSLVTRHWTLSPSEIRVLTRPDVLEKYRANPPEWYAGMFSGEQKLQILNVLKNAGEVENQDEKSVLEFINKQPPWLREALIVILEEEIKKGRPATVPQSSVS